MKPANLFISLFMAIAMLFTANVIAADVERYGKQKVVYHINYDNPKAQAGAMRNIQNHINAVGKDNLDLKVVLHGNGVSLLMEPEAAKDTKLAGNATQEMQATISGLKDQGVEFNICANTLKGKKVANPAHQLYDFSESQVVPSGVAEVARLEAMGYAYIKP
jgi:intracellular sulfur oxidation DsrE/DsrF family protein